ncbi:glycine cleavage system aminomethyltransferase GcvT [uncultured Sunxiuqinia sp.]|uniref:glycine cleavage system aminomethyltransferase GcvT n=1 Tax=uncultured Sunxiuqinia sp. TaxID=1573825 RepID=UPI00262F2ED0|nr:glycine cleavage system aminomethyltransferase GcvT [uncultured Sunxiuqinia sp.]
MKKTALNQLHKQAGGKMVEFAGYEMPVEFSGIKDEHLTVRNGVGVFDVSHMGEFWVKGPKAAALVQKLTTNDISKLRMGQAQYTCFPNGKGGIVDDLLVYYYEPEKYLLVVNASNIEKDWDWVVSQNQEGAELENASDRISLLAIQGPKAMEVLQKLTRVNLSDIPFYTFVTDEFAGIDDVIISATGYTGSGGFELYFDNAHAEAIYKAIFEAGEEFGIKPIGLGARDTLRLEMGFCLYGNDIDDTTSPIEAGLGWITKFNEDNDFIDKELLSVQKTEGVERKLRGFEMIDRGIPRHGYELTDQNGVVIGQVTSGTQSPMLNKGIGMGYVAKEYSAFGTEIYVKVRTKLLKAKVVKVPFVSLQ